MRYTVDRMLSLNQPAVDVFIRGLPGDLGIQVYAKGFPTSDKVYKTAVELATQVDARVLLERLCRSATRYPNQDYYPRQPRSAGEEHISYEGWTHHEETPE